MELCGAREEAENWPEREAWPRRHWFGSRVDLHRGPSASKPDLLWASSPAQAQDSRAPALVWKMCQDT